MDTFRSRPEPDRPVPCDPAATAAWQAAVAAAGYAVDDPWVGGYVAWEWRTGRRLIEAYAPPLAGLRALEFGCNVGATSTVLAACGARVTAVDIDPRKVEIARLNVLQHGFSNAEFLQSLPGRALPCRGPFDLVTCNSVLEYVAPADLGPTLADLDAVLAPGGTLLVLGTSNRLYPREVHSRRFSNWIPRAFDGRPGSRQRGIFPGDVRRHLAHYEDLVRADGGRAWREARRRIGDDGRKLALLGLMSVLGRVFGLAAGETTPSFFQALRKPQL